ncbi:MAG: acyl-CoA dehydrogenase [Deltaproteobacteria bacterium HGW-Deltaproteobacteria-20]|nr:MAG: acyl-CoA dehydrogenase [Deltaproteobacteria bacterium HGW-Deltaproteobacteria-20]
MDRSFMKSLFQGVLAEQLVYPYPSMEPDERENVKMMLDSVRRFAESHVDSARIDAEARIPDAVLKEMKELGLFGMVVPPDYGGIGLSTTAFARVMEEVAYHDASLAVVLGAHQAIGFRALLQFGSEAQRKRYLPRLATGEWIAAFALTEPSAGSDASAITTRAELASDGETYLLNGVKCWVTNGSIADVFTVFARTAPSTGGNRPRITAFIVDRSAGVRSGQPEAKLGVRGTSTTEVVFDDVPVRASNVLGEVGRGFKVAMEVLNAGRLSLASGCIGNCKRLIRLTSERAQERRAFGRRIGEFELIKDKIAWMMSETWALESMTYLTTGLVDARVSDYSLESAICKTFGSETLWRVAYEALQVAGGAGYMSSLPFERMLRDARVNPIFEGTNEILRLFIALSGMQGPARAMDEVTKAIREPIKGLGLLSDFAVRKAKNAFGRQRLSRVHPVLSPEVEMFEDYAAELARNVERSIRIHGKGIAERELVQRRMAEMATDLYALTACLFRTTHEIERFGEDGASLAIELTRTFSSGAEQRLRCNNRGFDQNQDWRRMSIADQTYAEGKYPFDVAT